MACVPPPEIICFGQHTLDPAYRQALLAKNRNYTTEEIVNCFLGRNSEVPSQAEWMISDTESDTDSD